MRKASLLMGAALASALAIAAHEPEGKGSVTVVGEVIDTVCYVHHGSRGADHAECARECAAQGIPLAIREEKTGRVYLSLPVDHTNPNTKLLDFISKRVEVKGEIYSKGGLRGIHVQSVRERPAEIKGKK